MNPSYGLSQKTNFTLWRICAWGGPIYLFGLMVFWALIGKFFPPPPEFWSADEVTSFYLQDNIRIRIGMVGTCFFGPFLILWSIVISRVIQRIEGPDGILSTIELIGGVITAIVVMLFGIVWMTASFRTELRSPQDIQMLQDIGWFIFDMTFVVTLFQLLAFGTAVALDRRADPLFPKWLGWFAYFAGLVFLPVLVMPFMMTGPFAWHGIIGFYLAIGPYFPWAVATCYYLFKAIDKVEAEASRA